MSGNVKKRLLLLGGGHSQIEVLRQFVNRPVAGIDVVLVSLDSYSLYSGMLPGYIAGHYAYGECVVDLSSLAQAAGATFIQCEVNHIDAENNLVRCANSLNLVYDVLAVNIGATSAAGIINGAESHAVKVKPVNSFQKEWNGLLHDIESATHPLNIAVVGGGAGGVELLLAIAWRCRQLQEKQVNHKMAHNFHLFSDAAELLPSHHPGVRRKFARIFSERGIEVHLNQRVTGMTSSGLQREDGSVYAMDYIILATQATAPAWVRQTGLATDDNGFILVNDFLQSTSHPDVFAAGDISTSENHPRPKSGVIAVRQGPLLAENLQRYLSGLSLCEFKPQKKFLALISCGEKYAVASRGALVLEGRWLWALKNWIDRRHVMKYRFPG